MMQFDKDLPYYPANVEDTILVEKSKRNSLIKRLEKLEEENRKMKDMLGNRANRMYSKKEKQLQHIYILADALEGKTNSQICKDRGKGYSRSAVSRVLAVNAGPEMTTDELNENRKQDLARLRKIYDRDEHRLIIFAPFELVEEWYDARKIFHFCISCKHRVFHFLFHFWSKNEIIILKCD